MTGTQPTMNEHTHQTKSGHERNDKIVVADLAESVNLHKRKKCIGPLCAYVFLSFLPNTAWSWQPRVRPYETDAATVLLLHLDGSARDVSERRTSVETHAAVWLEDGVIGGAVECSGETKLSTPTPAGLEKGFTVEAWVRIKRPKQACSYVVAKRRGTFQAGFDVDPLGRCRPYMLLWTNEGGFAARTYEQILFDRWVHVAFVYDPTAQQDPPLALYVHGEKVRSCKRKEEWMATGTLKPGEGPLMLLDGLVGAVDELRISAKARSPNELVCPWFSGRWGDFEPFKPNIVNESAPDDWDTIRVWLTAVESVPTFNSISLYARFSHDANRNAKCKVRYRSKPNTRWQRGMDLVRSSQEPEFRGSILLLAEDTEYEIDIRAEDPDGTAPPGDGLRLTQRTWREQVPVAESRALPAGLSKEPLRIRARGKADGWIRYAPPKGSTTTIDVGRSAPYAVEIEGSAYIILEGLTARGGSEHGMFVTNSHHVRIRRCEITDWGLAGRKNSQGLYVRPSGGIINCQDAIRLGLMTRQIVVEDNYIHTPSGTATDWRFGHPVGPQATTLGYNGSCNNVVRNNEMIGTEHHWYNDIIGSTGNGSPFGGPYRDTDIHGNFLSHSQDNAVELDGGQMNVRFWNNRMEYTYRSMSFAPCIKGPAYAMLNLVAHPGDEFLRSGTAFKMGASPLNFGLDLIFFNTVVGRSGSGMPNSAEPFFKLDRTVYVQNNLSARPGTFFDPSDPYQAHPSDEMFAFEDVIGADYRLRATAAGVDEGEPIPGFDRIVTGRSPELGLFECGGASDGIMPKRTSGIDVTPQHATLVATSGEQSTGKSATVMLTIPRSAGQRWIARPNEPWLICRPSTGATGTPTQVTISCNPQDLDARLHRAVITFRTDTGLNRSITVGVQVLHSQPYIRFFETEEATFTGAVQIGKDEAASSERYIHVTSASSHGVLTITFDVPAQGDYYVLGRFYTPPTSSGGWLYSMDGAPPKQWLDNSKSVRFWVWDLLRPHEFKNVRTVKRGFQLTEGRHTLVLTSRKPGTRLDCLVVSNQPYVPLPRKSGTQE